MKKINSITFSKLAAGVLLAVGAVFVTGCSKDAKEDVALPGEGTRVVISVGGISEVGSGTPSKVKAAAGSVAKDASNAALIEGEAFDVLVTRPASSSSNLSFKDKVRSAATSAEGLKAETPMTSGTAYRVFIRKAGTTTLTSLALTSGTAGSLPVDADSDYEWFALSYNNTTAIPDASGEDVDLSDIDGLLYAKGEFTVGSGTDVVVPLAIVFKPRVTKAVIEINTMGMFAPVAAATVNVNGLYAAPEAINVVTGDLIGGAQTLAINYADFAPVANFDGQRLSTVAYVGGNAGEDISVAVSNLSITLDDNTTRSFPNATLTQEFTPEAGMEQNIVLNFIESPLTYGTVGTQAVKWSRSNLYYRTDVLASNPYRFNHKNDYSSTTDPNSFFSFKGHLPRKLGSANAALQKDPCAFVYPAGLWKTPSQAEMAVVTSRSGVLGNLLGSIGDILGLGKTPGASFGANWIQYDNATGSNTAYGASSNVLRFNYNGLKTNVGLVEGLISVDLLDSKGTSAAFWTNQPGVSIPILGTGVGTWSYLGYTAGLLQISKIPVGSSAASLLDIDLVGLNVVSSALMNVRCVRDGSWNPDATGYDPYPDLSSL